MTLAETIQIRHDRLSPRHLAMSRVIVETVESLDGSDPVEMEQWEAYARRVVEAPDEELVTLVEQGYVHVLWLRDERAQAHRAPTESFPPERLVVLRDADDVHRRAPA